MLENSMGHGLFSLTELNRLRLEAIELFEQCLTNGDESALLSFIEQQVLSEPPRLELLREMADDLQQRLLSLREYHFDVRDRVVSTFNESYGIDITPLTPPATLERYHHLTASAVLAFASQMGAALSDEDSALLRKMIDASLQMAAQLHSDIQLTARLHQLVQDWLEGMSVAVAKQYWNARASSNEKTEGNVYH